MLGNKDDYLMEDLPTWIECPDFLYNEYRILVIECTLKAMFPSRDFLSIRKEAIAQLKEKYPSLGIVDNIQEEYDDKCIHCGTDTIHEYTCPNHEEGSVCY